MWLSPMTAQWTSCLHSQSQVSVHIKRPWKRGMHQQLVQPSKKWQVNNVVKCLKFKHRLGKLNRCTTANLFCLTSYAMKVSLSLLWRTRTVTPSKELQKDSDAWMYVAQGYPSRKTVVNRPHTQFTDSDETLQVQINDYQYFAGLDTARGGNIYW